MGMCTLDPPEIKAQWSSDPKRHGHHLVEEFEINQNCVPIVWPQLRALFVAMQGHENFPVLPRFGDQQRGRLDNRFSW